MNIQSLFYQHNALLSIYAEVPDQIRRGDPLGRPYIVQSSDSGRSASYKYTELLGQIPRFYSERLQIIIPFLPS